MRGLNHPAISDAPPTPPALSAAVFVPADCYPLLLFRWVRVVAVIGRGHCAVRVQPAEDGVGDGGQLVDLFGSQGVDHVLPDVGNVAWRGLTDLPPTGGRQAGVGCPGVLGTGE